MGVQPTKGGIERHLWGARSGHQGYRRRNAVAALIATPDLSAEMRTRFAELEMKHAAKTLHLPPATERGTSPKRHFQEQISCGATMDKICKWSVRYDGVGGLTTPGVVDTGATRSIIRKDMIGFIPHIIASKASSNTIQMADGSLRDSKQMITVEVYAGDVFFNLELLVLRQSVDHLTLGMDFLAKAGTTITMGNTTVNITKHNAAQGPKSTHRSEQPSQPKNSKLARQTTNDNAEKTDIENMVRFDKNQ
uniref:Peptidase A2 domain-containing protein n=1 Tax=Glossina austeni TaxID=7395 RepID=A0A1A9UDR5_GLOAU